MMRASDVVTALDCLAAANVAVWLDGGWGVDALIAEQSRPHDDLDVVIALDQVATAQRALGRLGYGVVEDELPTRLVMRAPDDRRIDFHAVTFDEAHGGIQALQNGTAFRYPPEGFTGLGYVGGRSVQCLTPEIQALCHYGYEPDENDSHDMRLLHARFGVALRAPYAVSEQSPIAATGVVLAGGASRRMGQDKAALPLGGEPLLAHVVRRLGASIGEVMVVGPLERQTLVPGVRVIPDARPDMGPLGGIFTALQAATTAYIFVVACDMPFVQPELVRYLLGLAPGYAVVVPRSARGTEQLHAVYGRVCLPAVAALLDVRDLTVASLYQRVRTRVVAPEDWAAYDTRGLSTFNVNTPAEWERARALLAEVATSPADAS